MNKRMVLVKNVNGSDRFLRPAGYASWLDYWERQVRQRATHCFAFDCNRTDLVGAHVQLANSSDRHYYIVPLCEKCNHRPDTFFVEESALIPVPSNL